MFLVISLIQSLFKMDNNNLEDEVTTETIIDSPVLDNKKMTEPILDASYLDDEIGLMLTNDLIG